KGEVLADRELALQAVCMSPRSELTAPLGRQGPNVFAAPLHRAGRRQRGAGADAQPRRLAGAVRTDGECHLGVPDRQIAALRQAGRAAADRKSVRIAPGLVGGGAALIGRHERPPFDHYARFITDVYITNFKLDLVSTHLRATAGSSGSNRGGIRSSPVRHSAVRDAGRMIRDSEMRKRGGD